MFTFREQAKYQLPSLISSHHSYGWEPQANCCINVYFNIWPYWGKPNLGWSNWSTREISYFKESRQIIFGRPPNIQYADLTLNSRNLSGSKIQVHLSSREFGEIGMCQISSMVAFPNHCLSCWISLPELSELRSWETSKVSSGLTLLWEWDIRNLQIHPYPDWATNTNWNTSFLWDETLSAY